MCLLRVLTVCVVWDEVCLSVCMYVLYVCTVCMYSSVCMWDLPLCIIIFFDNYFDSFSLTRIVWGHSAHHIRLLWPQRGGGSPAGKRCRDRSPEQCKEMRRR